MCNSFLTIYYWNDTEFLTLSIVRGFESFGQFVSQSLKFFLVHNLTFI